MYIEEINGGSPWSMDEWVYNTVYSHDDGLWRLLHRWPNRYHGPLPFLREIQRVVPQYLASFAPLMLGGYCSCCCTLCKTDGAPRRLLRRLPPLVMSVG